jgi:hypothetical protein
MHTWSHYVQAHDAAKVSNSTAAMFDGKQAESSPLKEKPIPPSEMDKQSGVNDAVATQTSSQGKMAPDAVHGGVMQQDVRGETT